MIRQRGLDPQDRPEMAALIESIKAFSDEERAVAIELVDHRLEHPSSDDYRFILALSAPESGGPERLAGYLCYGRTPLTRSTYDLYWIVTSPDFARSGVARGLLASMEGEIARAGGGLIRIETTSREGQGAAIHFYDATGFRRTATIPNFYAPADDLLILTKRVCGDAHAAPTELDQAALHDVAFGYRDYALERDFLLACARRFGDRDVRRVLAWSAGTGRHLKAFADVGIDGISAALDKPLTPAPNTQADLSFVPLSAIHQLASPDAIAQHLRGAAALLHPGGIHVIEATHPAQLLASGANHTEWTELRGDVTIDARLRIHVDRMNPDRVVPVTLEVMRTTGKKGTTTRIRREERWFVPHLPGWKQIIASVPNLTLVTALGDFNVSVPFEHQAAWRLLLVIKRT